MAETKGPILIAEQDYAEGSENGYGVCLACGDLNEGAGGWCEPDARGYECDNCGERRLMGLSEALCAGKIAFGDVEPAL